MQTDKGNDLEGRKVRRRNCGSYRRIVLGLIGLLMYPGLLFEQEIEHKNFVVARRRFWKLKMYAG